jgi:hypothetical protein
MDLTVKKLQLKALELEKLGDQVNAECAQLAAECVFGVPGAVDKYAAACRRLQRISDQLCGILTLGLSLREMELDMEEMGSALNLN